MSWKERLKWKILTILIALIGILIVWCAGEAGKRQHRAESKILKEYMIKENERSSAKMAFESEAPKAEAQEVSETASKTDAETVSDPEIKVLLMTNGYESYYHHKISLQFQGDYEMQGSEKVSAWNGEVLEFDAENWGFSEECVTFVPKNRDSTITVLSLERGQGNPSYKGKLTVRRADRGLSMVNELPLEQYLCGVVPSEMPASYPMEALKAQAVCARTYACVQMLGSKLESMGAQVDDSVAFQVYQNSGEAESSSEAVLATAGQVMLHDKAPINAYYFSTSHGKTSTDEVWEAAVPAAYLKSVECTYDAAQPWYQWSVSLSAKQILENIQKRFSEIKRVDGVEIGKKGEGEAVLNLILHTDRGDQEIHSEYEIRSVLAPTGQSITRQDGSVVKGGGLLPSAYFTLEEKKDEKGNLLGYAVLGGGYGHGVGMSQNGAKGLADAGKDYSEILLYFYNAVEIGNIKDIVNSGNS